VFLLFDVLCPPELMTGITINPREKEDARAVLETWFSDWFLESPRTADQVFGFPLIRRAEKD
jgi:hypothetical protein